MVVMGVGGGGVGGGGMTRRRARALKWAFSPF